MSEMMIRIDGVPEHFNLPWRSLADSDLLSQLGYLFAWTEVPEGTGSMIERLRTGKSDMALLLTEGAVAGIANGGGYRIVGEYIASPLLWGIHVAADSPIQTESQLPGQSFAISRYGSGSHLMAGVYAQQQAWPESPNYRVIDNLSGARAALRNGDAEIFLWEQFTTQPLVDAGEFRRVGVLPTPWPCFVACLSDQSKLRPSQALELLRLALASAAVLRNGTNAVARFAQRYALRPDQVEQWLAHTQWSRDGVFDPSWVAKISAALRQVNMIERDIGAAEALADATSPTE